MPKPVLSDSLFNADDVATAILNSANLAVTNQDFGVVDRTSNFTNDSAFSINNFNAHSFNGFMFVSCQGSKTSTPSNAESFTVVDSDFRPSVDYVFPIIGYQGDVAAYVKLIASTGAFEIHSPTNAGISTFYFAINGVYRFT